MAGSVAYTQVLVQTRESGSTRAKNRADLKHNGSRYVFRNNSGCHLVQGIFC